MVVNDQCKTSQERWTNIFTFQTPRQEKMIETTRPTKLCSSRKYRYHLKGREKVKHLFANKAPELGLNEATTTGRSSMRP